MSNESETNGLSDERLVEMLNRGSKAHARLLYRRYDSRILKYHMRKGFSRPEAEELTQDTFFRVFRTLRNQGLQGRFIGLLYQAAYHAFVDYLEECDRQKRGEQIDDPEKGVEIANTDRGADATLQQSDLQRGVWAAVSRLKEQPRRVMELHLEEFSYKEIAEILDLTSGHVGRIIFDAKKQLKQYLKEYY